ncbi:hypothetical protein J8L85_03360 [Maribacter sp. MMG018]|uniref:tetratricopeptide repeat protein n=1 Tax=Maribacter sp. MMG018 TaxID=2822688 RepID=UPI001B367DDF|nr:hypothetical protein [Maribacter sp. MMG018]MBQ4913459.1 hypothetical protein [Maribacter sp. MMG018]
MRTKILMLLICLGIYLIPMGVCSQEDNRVMVEESAEVFLDEYSDDFQVSFFEALKQKGIQNYDKAINALLKCKEMGPEKDVVAYELAKTYLLDKQYINAQQFAEEAIAEDPENYWYAHILAKTMDAQNSSIELVKEHIPWKNDTLKANIAKAYFELGKYRLAKSILEEVKNMEGLDYLKSRINDSINKEPEKIVVKSYTTEVGTSSEVKSLMEYKNRLKGLISIENSATLILQVSEDALENYPSQPYFYYANGYALNRTRKNRQAIESLETALDYLIGDISLGNKIYKELADAYNALNNPTKANMYLRKIKPGF